MNKLNYFKQVLQNSKNNKVTVYAFIIIILIGLSVYGFFFYRTIKEKELSIKINNLVESHSLLVKEKENNTKTLLQYQQELEIFASNFYEMYQKNSTYSESFRALFFSANINYELENFEKAQEKYELMFENSKDYFLTPLAVLHLIFINENFGNNQKAIELIQNFRLYYPNHFVKGEILLALARNYFFLKQEDEAKIILQDILQNQNLTTYYEVAQEWLNLFAINKKQLSKTNATNNN